MQRYFFDGSYENGQATITGDDAKHMMKVMRMRENDEIIIVHNASATVNKIITFTDNDVVVEKTTTSIPSPELPIQVTIACGLPKGDKLDLIVQKATELGMYALLPFEAQRSIVKWDAKKGDKKQQRLQKIAKEAAEQSHRTIIPTVHASVNFKQLLATASQFDAIFIADEEDAKLTKRLRLVDHVKKIAHYQNLLIVFGPEGGIDRHESTALLEIGATTVSLGPRILRTETAPLYFLSALSYELE
ncbi:16S rRNA (uracil(1498)-N(3))-methyltransferase [Kurthia sibirica]|uniref:Ribosomal RNA small subunit methyltransferase E n=1 Tax=Kurthia sibirica TaxID=202750 RepID=A0A2U3AK02_9BACL|nr:16S rRNA (uracil(1498)-N(3))-methyltransferase [Kurthia sibirica]PWI24853.1 16S rRNA (uracil(1498)-N(3))-methyltransferase [Kurthia sibirica]GEK33297.1 ribosomal RNA small subunit methyltransferase E [Kurthia sibirica]